MLTVNLSGWWNSKQLGKTSIPGGSEDMPGKALMIVTAQTIMAGMQCFFALAIPKTSFLMLKSGL